MLSCCCTFAGYVSGYAADKVGHDMAATLTAFAQNGDGPMDEAHRVRTWPLPYLSCCGTPANKWLLNVAKHRRNAFCDRMTE